MAWSSMFLLTIVGVSFVLINARTPPRQCYDENSEYKKCGSACPATCNNPKPKPCIQKCTDGCFCKKGFLQIDALEKICVEEKLCISCSGNRTYTYGGVCPETCNKEDSNKPCTKQAVLGCFCKKGYVFVDGDKKKCVLPQDCPNKITKP